MEMAKPTAVLAERSFAGRQLTADLDRAATAAADQFRFRLNARLGLLTNINDALAEGQNLVFFALVIGHADALLAVGSRLDQRFWIESLSINMPDVGLDITKRAYWRRRCEEEAWARRFASRTVAPTTGPCSSIPATGPTPPSGTPAPLASTSASQGRRLRSISDS